MTNKDKAESIVKDYGPQGKSKGDESMAMGKEKAIGALFSAIEKKDKGAAVEALSDFYEMCGE